MAKSKEEPSRIYLKGYDLSILCQDKKDNKYLCNACELILRDPVQSACGHRYCYNCFRNICGQEPVECPACLKEDAFDPDYSYMKANNMYPDMAMRREMANFEAQCPNQGCNWSGKFKNFKEHELTCKFQGIVCPDCGKNVPEYKIQEHNLKQCLKRKVNCEACGQVVRFCDIKEHLSKYCPKAPTQCTACHKKVIREELEKHCAEECSKRIIPCPAGCSEVLHYDQFQTHLQKNSSLHLKYVLETLPAVERKLMEKLNSLVTSSSITRIEEKLGILTSKIEALENRNNSQAGAAGAACANAYNPGDEIGLVPRVASTELRLNAFEPIMGVLHKEIEKTISTLEMIEQRFGEQERRNFETSKRVEELDKEVKELTQKFIVRDLTFSQYELQFESLELARHDGTLIWRISGFQQKRRDAVTGKTTSLYSPTFYTSHVGYKMCARLYPNGDGIGKGSHISLFFVLMRGPYDNLLSWPFGEKVTLTLIDQNMKEHVVDTFKPDPTSTSFKKPDTEMNIASGCPLFLPLAKLNDPSSAYVKDDTIFVRISVDPSTTSSLDLNHMKGQLPSRN